MTTATTTGRVAAARLLSNLRQQASLLGRQHCTLCLARTKHLPYALCPECDCELPRLRHACLQCALPLPAAECPADSNTEQQLCGKCLNKPPYFDRCYAALEYRSPADQLIPQLKYAHQFAHAHLLAALMVEQLLARREAAPWPDIAVPVPLHWSRRLNRGFNQCNLLAGHIEAQLRAQLGHSCTTTNYSLAKRIVPTRSQAGQNEKQRQRNMRDVFAIRSGLVLKRVLKNVPKTVAIVDDVVTTGATANELAKQLKMAGAQRVEVWCAARTPAPG